MMKQYKKEGEEIFHSRWLYTYITCVLYKIINFFFFALADIFHHYNVMCKACMPCTRLLTYLHSFHIYFSAIIKKNIFFCLAFSRWFLWLLATSFHCLTVYMYGWVITHIYNNNNTILWFYSSQAGRQTYVYPFSLFTSSLSCNHQLLLLLYTLHLYLSLNSHLFLSSYLAIIRTLALSFPICLCFTYIFYMILCVHVFRFFFVEKLDYLPFIFKKRHKNIIETNTGEESYKTREWIT